MGFILKSNLSKEVNYLIISPSSLLYSLGMSMCLPLAGLRSLLDLDG